MKQIRLEEAIGKTIKDFGENLGWESIVITFTDDTFIYLQTEADWRNNSKNIEQSEYRISDFSHREAIRLGIVTQEEIEADQKRRQAQLVKQQEESERAQYERLKKKYDAAN